MRILITGAAGFIGSNVANCLSDKYEITGVDNLQFGNIDNINSDIEFIEDSFANVDTDDYDVLIHCACANIIYAQDHPIETFKTNALESIDLFSNFHGRIIYTSTASVYGASPDLPTPEHAVKRTYNAYDQSKLIAEKFLEQRGDYTTLRLSNVYGPNQRADNPYSGVIGKFITAGLEDQPMKLYGAGTDTRDYTYISDVVDAIDRAIQLDSINDVVNISGGEEVSAYDLAVFISELMDIPVKIQHVPKRTIDSIPRRLLDSSRAEQLLGWQPETNLETGLINTIQWNISKY